MNDKTMMINGVEYKTGDYVTCIITGRKITDARIHITRDEAQFPYEPIVHICQNIACGNSSPDMLGYKYSWQAYMDRDFDAFDGAVQKLEHKNKEAFKDILTLSFPGSERIKTKEVINAKTKFPDFNIDDFPLVFDEPLSFFSTK